MATAPDRQAAVRPGQVLPALEVGPLTLVDFVRWAAYQENWLPVHYDRDHAAARLGLRDCIQSGHHRTALIMRMLTDWLGATGWVRHLAVRHLAPVFPGDLLQCGGRVRTVADRGGDGWTAEVDVWAVTPGGQTATEGTAVVEGMRTPPPGTA